MNVDEAMEIATSTAITLTKLEMAEVAELLAAEVERLRAEVEMSHSFHRVAVKERDFERLLVEALKEERAAAKAASRCPARVENIYDTEYPSDCYIECWNGDECMKFRDWLYDRIKERDEG